jgi:hypothetical protein
MGIRSLQARIIEFIIGIIASLGRDNYRYSAIEDRKPVQSRLLLLLRLPNGE